MSMTESRGAAAHTDENDFNSDGVLYSHGLHKAVHCVVSFISA